MTAPRLFPDFAAAPTAAERRATRHHWQNAPPTLFELTESNAAACPVCAGDHPADDCPHGTAPTLI